MTHKEDIKNQMAERRITAYVAPVNRRRFAAYQKKHKIPMSRALDMLMTEFFTVKK
jgi:hypothetical protein